MNNDFDLILNDYQSSNDPKWYDPVTIGVLSRIVDSICKKEYSKCDFEDFANSNLGNGDFKIGCVNFVRCVCMYFDRLN